MAKITDPFTGREYTYITRADWGARPARHVAYITSLRRFFVHWAVTKAPATLSAGKATMRAIQNFHMDVRGWSDFAYSFAVDQDGRIYEGRGHRRSGGHTFGWNNHSEAVVFLGGPGDVPTSRAKEAMAAIRNIEAHGVISAAHSRMSATACPGPDLTPWANDGMPINLSPRPPKPKPPAPGVPWKFKAYRKPTVLSKERDATSVRRDTAEVQFLSNVLNGSDHKQWVAVDGRYGPKTATAVRRFQELFTAYIRPIGRDGKFGPETAQAFAEVLQLKGIW